jgi:uncharacterized protein (TIGR03437 family)
VQAASVPLPTTLGGVAVFINGFPAPLLYASPGQINLQIPWEVAGEGTPVTVVFNGVVGNTVSLDVGQSQPVLYGITNADGTSVTGARAGDVLIIRATGLGPVNGNPVTGRASPADPLLRTRELPTVRVGGVSAEVLFSGLVGVYQLNARLSAGVPAGSQTPVVVGVGSQISAPLLIPTL